MSNLPTFQGRIPNSKVPVIPFRLFHGLYRTFTLVRPWQHVVMVTLLACDEEALSAGILIYNGLVDLLLPAFTSSRLLVGRTYLQLFAMFCVCSGFTLMAFLAKWA